MISWLTLGSRDAGSEQQVPRLRRRSRSGCARNDKDFLSTRHIGWSTIQPDSYFVITPQAMRSPELPEGSVL